ncbi:MAG: 2-hydroxyacyl-CoA dehydratase family protein [Desulfovibrio sp.]|nr:2-hydroxyacyl-CoA dehydratase family protein [Desulfovibrio sp.]
MAENSTLPFETGIFNASIEAWQREGKKVVGTICCHVPEEIIHAAGMLPVRIRATGCTDDSAAEVWMSSFSCSFARSCMQFFLDGRYSFLDGVVCSDGCLMAQRFFDNLNHQFKDLYQQLVVAPRLYTDEAVPFYREELERFLAGMEKLSGNKITEEKLKNSIDVYNETRRLIREFYDLRKGDAPPVSGEESLKVTLAAMSMPKEEFNRRLNGFIREVKEREPSNGRGVRLMIIGSTLDDPEYVKIIESKGGSVVTDVQCYGSRYLWEPTVPGKGDMLDSLARSYLSRPVCPRMCNLHTGIYDFIHGMARDFSVDGILYVKMKNCDLWGGESVHIEDKLKAAKIPLLTVEREEIMTNVGQLAVRAEAFIEMIEGGAGR